MLNSVLITNVFVSSAFKSIGDALGVIEVSLMSDTRAATFFDMFEWFRCVYTWSDVN